MSTSGHLWRVISSRIPAGKPEDSIETALQCNISHFRILLPSLYLYRFQNYFVRKHLQANFHIRLFPGESDLSYIFSMTLGHHLWNLAYFSSALSFLLYVGFLLTDVSLSDYLNSSVLFSFVLFSYYLYQRLMLLYFLRNSSLFFSYFTYQASYKIYISHIRAYKNLYFFSQSQKIPEVWSRGCYRERWDRVSRAFCWMPSNSSRKAGNGWR